MESTPSLTTLLSQWTPHVFWIAGLAALAIWYVRSFRSAARRGCPHPRWRLALFLPTAIYGGYFGAGMGVVMMALFSVTSDWSVRSANAVKNMMGAAVNWVAIVIFTLQGVVAWPQTLVMLTGALIGGYAGGRLLRVVPAPWIRGFVVAMGLVMTVYYAGKYWF